MRKELKQTDKIIWSYWHDPDNMPELVNIAKQSWKRHNPEYIICFMNQHNLSKYVNVNKFPERFSVLSHQHKADVIRIAVLSKYGGIWLDSTFIVTEPLHLKWDNQYDVGGYYLQGFTTNQNKKVFENWFISAPKNSELIKQWEREFYYGLSYDKASDYIDHLEETVDLQNIHGKDYLMMHCSFLKVINDKEYNIKQFEAEKGPFQWLVDNNWHIEKSVLALFYKDINYTNLKIRGCERGKIEQMMRYIPYCLYKNSTIGRLIKYDI